MAEDDQHGAEQPAAAPRSGNWTVVAGAASHAEAELICSQLLDAGIPAEIQRSIGGPEWGESGGQYIKVAPANVDRAQELLASFQGISEAELLQAAEADDAQRAAGEPARPGTESDARELSESLGLAPPKRTFWDRLRRRKG
jgi:hypothetical protein